MATGIVTPIRPSTSGTSPTGRSPGVDASASPPPAKRRRATKRRISGKHKLPSKQPRRAPKKASTRDLANMYRRFRTQPPQMTKEQMAAIDEDCRGPAQGVDRRIMLASLTRTGAELIAAAIEDDESGETVAQMIVRIQSYERRLRQLADWAQTAHIRLMMALAGREDMQQLLKSADASEKAAGRAEHPEDAVMGAEIIPITGSSSGKIRERAKST